MLLSRVLKIVISAVAVSFLMAQGSVQDELRDKPVAQFTVEKASLLSAVMKLSSATGVPMGVELSSGPEGPDFSLDSRQTTLGAELDRIISNVPQYQWKQTGSVINIFPVSEVDSVFNVVIHQFDAKDVPPIQIVQELLRDAAVARYLAAKKIVAATWITGSVPLSRASLTIENKTLREALNDCLIASNRPGWTAFYQQREQTKNLWFQLW